MSQDKRAAVYAETRAKIRAATGKANAEPDLDDLARAGLTMADLEADCVRVWPKDDELDDTAEHLETMAREYRERAKAIRAVHVNTKEPLTDGERAFMDAEIAAALASGLRQVVADLDAEERAAIQQAELIADPDVEARTTEALRRMNGKPAGLRDEVTAAAPRTSPRLGDILDASLLRVDRRCSGTEKPIPLKWPVLEAHFGGGFWPGLHVIVAPTGTGKTQFSMGQGLHAARQGVPVLYVGLELAELDLGLRALGDEAGVPWSHLWTGKAGPEYVRRAREAAPDLAKLPFHFEVARPYGFPVSTLRDVVEAFRAQYPETDGPGSRPLMVIVDFLQLVGDEPGDEQEIRIRISRASYALRDFATRLSIAVLAISSIARDRVRLTTEMHSEAKLTWEEDLAGCPINRRIGNVDAIIGAGKESGDIEFSADSVTIIGKVPGTFDGHGVDVVVATAKGRATGATWSPLRFTGFGYEECPDRGGRILEAWAEGDEKRAAAREEKRQAKETAKQSRVRSDAEAVRRFVTDNPGCSVREARAACVAGVHARWVAAMDVLGGEIVQDRPKANGPVLLTVAGPR